MTIDKLDKIKENLPRGAFDTIAADAGVSKSTVYKVLSGKRENIKVLDLASKMAIDSSQKNNDVRNRIQKL